jgi:hypothetical protein
MSARLQSRLRKAIRTHGPVVTPRRQNMMCHMLTDPRAPGVPGE